MSVEYIVTVEEAWHDEPVSFTLKAARKARKLLQVEIDKEAKDMDAVPDEVKIFRIEEVS